jgi:hypothetical protein
MAIAAQVVAYALDLDMTVLIRDGHADRAAQLRCRLVLGDPTDRSIRHEHITLASVHAHAGMTNPLLTRT